MSDAGFLQRLKQRKVVEWTLAYLAGAWVVFEATGTTADVWGTPAVVLRSIHVLLVMGFFAAVILAWFHGEKGHQRLGRLEVMALAVVFLAFGGVLAWVGQTSPRGSTRDPAEISAREESSDFLAELSSRPGLMVLPFQNRSGLEEDEYFTDGMHDELLTRLQHAPGLRVVSRTTSDLYRHSDKPASEIAAENSVGYLLEGGVQRAGDRVRINVQLIEASTDDHLWADHYDRQLTVEDIFQIQSEIVEAVAGELTGALIEEERARVYRASTTSLDAYDLFLRSQQQIPDPQRAPLLREAIRLDPDFAAAHINLVTVLSRLYRVRSRDPAHATEARVAAERALDLEPEWPESHFASAFYYYFVERDLDRALELVNGAAEALRSSAQYNLIRGFIERRKGLWEEAVESFTAAGILSPSDASPWLSLFETELWMRRYEESEAALARVAGLNHILFPSDRARLSWMRDGNPSGYQSVAIPDNGWPTIRGVAIAAMISAGDVEQARVLLRDSGDRLLGGAHVYPKSLFQAWILEAQGETSRANGQYLKAVTVLREARIESPEDDRFIAPLALALGGAGLKEEALAVARVALDSYPVELDVVAASETRWRVAAVYARIGQKDEAVQILEEVLGTPGPISPQFLESHFLLEPLHDDPHFKALMDRERERVF